MNIFYLGDVMGEPGLQLVERELSVIRRELNIDVVIAQAENLSDGKGIRINDFERLQTAGVDFCTGGNHSFFREEIYPLLTDPEDPIIRPANYPDDMPGLGYKYLNTKAGSILVVSLLGQVVGRDADLQLKNPLQLIDQILEQEKDTKRVATVVNFHGDFSSEKVVIGHYLDGRVTMIVGDHWHVPTADARVQPKGTAHMTDVGMVGSLDSSLGVEFNSIIPRWRDGVQTRNILETKGSMQLNGLLVTVDESTSLATRAEYIRKIYET
jgi:metallophosphoesterase (TIGR00282 family)